MLWPADAGTPSEDPNQNAVVLVASYGETDVFLSADAESDVTARLPLRPVEIMKVAHHGSEDPGLADELETLRPRVAVISCGRNNDYGHPRPETLAALAGVAGSRRLPHRRGRPRRRRVGRPAPDRSDRSGSVGAMADAPDKPVYLITGSDRPKIETALTRLRGHFEAEAIESVSALDTSGEAAVALCNAGSLFGDARLIVVADVDGAKQADGRRKGGWKAADVEAVVGVPREPRARRPCSRSSAEELKASSALWKACAKAGTVLAFDVAKKELHEWVAEQFRAARRRAPSPTPSPRSSSSSATTCARSKVEVDKIATWAGDEPIGEREVEALVAPNADVPDLRAHRGVVGARLGARARRERDDLRAGARSRVATSLRASPARSASHLGRLRALKRLAAEGVKPKEAAERLKLHPFRAQKLYGQAEGFSDEELDDAVRAARRARRRAEGPEQARARPRGAADARRAHAAARRRVRASGRRARTALPATSRAARDFLRAAVFAMERATRRRAIDRPHELAVLGRDALGVAVGDRRLEALRQRLDRRAVAEVLDPLRAPGSGRASSVA